MILSVSRRTDIPNYYSEWFFHRLKEGYLYVRNPMNPHQVSRINIAPETVDCIVFWTKNPKPMMGRMEELRDYKYYFQFTLTGYGGDMEPNVPHKKEQMIPIFQELSESIGKERVIWRYDPILITDRYTVEYHRKAFREIAERLRGHTQKVIISFVDWYAKMDHNMKGVNVIPLDEEEMGAFAGSLAHIARENGLEIATCAELLDLSGYGIRHGSCIDQALVEQIAGYGIKVKKDKNQRCECGCVESVEVGSYDTCKNGCKYCYANRSMESVDNRNRSYHPASPLLCGELDQEDIITERKVRSLRA